MSWDDSQDIYFLSNSQITFKAISECIFIFTITVFLYAPIRGNWCIFLKCFNWYIQVMFNFFISWLIGFDFSCSAIHFSHSSFDLHPFFHLCQLFLSNKLCYFTYFKIYDIIIDVHQKESLLWKKLWWKYQTYLTWLLISIIVAKITSKWCGLFIFLNSWMSNRLIYFRIVIRD